ncbi:MAG TPA: hydrolase [Verrucomicrobiae bacterium]|nr:hydrolase [Verrucomicrobiae bacterium]
MSLRLKRRGTALLALDLQERLVPAMHGREALLQNVERLLKGAAVLGVPVLATEQYRKGLGPTIPQVAALIADFAPFEKLTFSGARETPLQSRCEAAGVSQLVLCGVETHVCVLQTCLDLLEHNLQVFVVADAVSSRTVANHQLGLTRMQQAGAVVVSTEMVLFELLERAGTAEFKAILELVK